MSVADLVKALQNVRAGSQFALRAALEALATDGAAGTLTIHIPRKPNDQLEIDFETRNKEK